METETKLETFRLEKKCDKCPDGFIICTGTGITQMDTSWKHKCNKCGHIEWHTNKKYPSIIYKTIPHAVSIDGCTKALEAIFMNTINRDFGGDKMYKAGVLMNIEMAVGKEQYNRLVELYSVK